MAQWRLLGALVRATCIPKMTDPQFPRSVEVGFMASDVLRGLLSDASAILASVDVLAAQVLATAEGSKYLNLNLREEQ